MSVASMHKMPDYAASLVAVHRSAPETGTDGTTVEYRSGLATAHFYHTFGPAYIV